MRYLVGLSPGSMITTGSKVALAGYLTAVLWGVATSTRIALGGHIIGTRWRACPGRPKWVRMTYPVTITLPFDTKACVQNWRKIVTGAGEVRIETTYNSQFTLACALLLSGAMTVEETMEAMGNEPPAT